MRKQTGFTARVVNLTRDSDAYGGTTPEQVNEYFSANYFGDGWTVLSAESTKVEGNSVFFIVFLVKYEDDEVAEKAKEKSK